MLLSIPRSSDARKYPVFNALHFAGTDYRAALVSCKSQQRQAANCRASLAPYQLLLCVFRSRHPHCSAPQPPVHLRLRDEKHELIRVAQPLMGHETLEVRIERRLALVAFDLQA